MVAIAENGRIPVDNPATHLELTMVHEAMVFEYSGRHLALIEAASALKLLLYISLIACFRAWGLAPATAARGRFGDRPRNLCRKARRGGCCSRCTKPASPRCGSSGCRCFSARRLMLALLATLLLLFVSFKEASHMRGIRRTISSSTSPICWPAGWCW